MLDYIYDLLFTLIKPKYHTMQRRLVLIHFPPVPVTVISKAVNWTHTYIAPKGGSVGRGASERCEMDLPVVTPLITGGACGYGVKRLGVGTVTVFLNGLLTY